MDLQQQVSHQRVQYIVDSYRLGGVAVDQFNYELAECLEQYPAPWIELALTDVLVDYWVTLSSMRGLPFIQEVKHRLRIWQDTAIINTITPQQFQQITGLDPNPVFGTIPSTSHSVSPHHCS